MQSNYVHFTSAYRLYIVVCIVLFVTFILGVIYTLMIYTTIPLCKFVLSTKCILARFFANIDYLLYLLRLALLFNVS